MSPRSTFAPVVLLGLASSALAAVAATRPWTEAQAPGGDPLDLPMIDYDALARDSPLAAALALVVLACWGVLLVTRGWFRRLAAGLATLGAAGFLATTIDAYWSLQESVADELAELGVEGAALDRSRGAVWMTDWWPAALVAGVLCLVAGVLAVRFAPSWPEMGSRYDAPGAAPEEARPVEEQSNLEVWKSLDEGHDPTQ